MGENISKIDSIAVDTGATMAMLNAYGRRKEVVWNSKSSNHQDALQLN